MPLSMPEGRLSPKDWTAEINAALMPSNVNSDIKKNWEALKAPSEHDGEWHKDVKEQVVVPYNILHGGWAAMTTVDKKTYPSLLQAQAKGTQYFVIGGVMPGGYADIYASLNNTTRNIYQNLWQQGASGGRGPNTFGSGGNKVTLEHKRIGAGRSEERLWYKDKAPFTAYYISEVHVDTTPAGVKQFNAMSKAIDSWGPARPILVGYLHMPTTCSQFFVIV